MMAHPDDMQDELGDIPGSPLTSRRRFIQIAGAAGLGLLLGGVSGCAPVQNQPSGGTALGNGSPLGTESSTYRAPAPGARPFPQAPERQIAADVCVVGGGAAGMCAATVAARMGAKTVLLEESYVLGGNITRGLVSLDRVAWGGDLMVAGWFADLINMLVRQGDAVFPGPQTGYTTPCDPDALRLAALSLALSAGVDIRLGTKAVWAQVVAADMAGADRQSKRIASVCADEHGLPIEITAPLFVDCTGEGNLGYMAGSSYWLGDRRQAATQGQTLIFCVAPVNVDQLWSYARTEGSQVEEYRIVGLRHFMAKLRSTGAVDGSPQAGMLIDRNLWPNMVSISASETYGNPMETGSLAEIAAVLETQNRQIHEALCTRVPGFAGSRIVRMAERPYLREGRRLTGYHQLSAVDIQQALKPPDSIARGYYPIDLHRSGEGGGVQTMYLEAGDWYGIPYRCIVSRELDNLLMAGRCISVTHEALGSTRISPVSMALGQAAGVAAALCARGGVRPADLPAAEVRAELHRQGALT